jgi:hypothetical protein
MDISGKTIWQQAAGDTNRDYSDLCLRWDVILNGPGNAGKWPDCKEGLQKDELSSKKITDLRRFADEMKDGDLVVLRIGTAKVLGLGQIVGPYDWRDEFGDIDGWDLQHIRRVRWFPKDLVSPKTFDTYKLKWGDTTQKLSPGPVKEWISTLTLPDAAFTRPLVNLPVTRPLVDLPVLKKQEQEISVAEISEFLFDRGVASSSIKNLLNEIGELIRISKWYQRSGNPSEHETVAYLVVPLLRALGWTPQRMAVEWNRVDVALFEDLPRSDESLRVVVEAKKMGNSCFIAVSQAEEYANGKAGCDRLIVTDGLRYGVYIRRGPDEQFILDSYMNLTRLRHDYPVYKCKGAEDALLAMAPEWKPKPI